MKRALASIVLCLFFRCLPASADAPSAVEAPKLPAILTRPITIERSYEKTELNTVLATLREKYKCSVTLDEASFGKGGKAVGQAKVTLWGITNAPCGLVLEMVARQVGGTISWEGDRLKLTAGKARDLKTLIGLPIPKFTTKLATPTQLARPIEKAPLKDILEFFGDKYELTIVLDNWAFTKAGINDVDDIPCGLAADILPLRKCLDNLAKKVNGIAIVGESVILIVPAPK
jgi:hypothetical protein